VIEGPRALQVKACEASIRIVQGHVFSGIRLNLEGSIEVLQGFPDEGSLHQFVGCQNQVWIGLGRDAALLKVVGQ